MKHILMTLITFMLIGCANQPNKVGTTQQPQVIVETSKIQLFKDKLVMLLADKDYYVVDSSNYKFDFRRDFKTNEDATARALMQAVDGSTINSKGIEVFILTQTNNTKIKAKPYLFKTFSYNRKNDEKYNMSNNNRWYNEVQSILNTANSNL